MPAAAWLAHTEQVNATIEFAKNVRMQWKVDFYPLETRNNSSWHSSQKKGQLELDVYDHDVTVKLKCLLKTIFPGYANLTMSGDILNEVIQINQSGQYIERELVLPRGKHVINFKTDAKQLDSGADPRQLFFTIYDFTLT